MNGLGEGDVAAVGEWRDDKALGAAEEFVLIGEGDVGDVDVHLVVVFVEVEASLLEPLEVAECLHAHLAHGVEDVTLVDVDLR